MNKLAIVCGSPSSEMDAPFDDPEYDIWVLGNRAERYPRFDLVFEIHDDLSEHGDIDRYIGFLMDLEVPVIGGDWLSMYMPACERYPFEEVKDLAGSTYLTSSSAYMLAYALLQGYKHIEIYGVDMAVDDHEYFWQRPCMEFWVGFAKGRGVTVVIPPVSPLANSDYVEGSGSGGRPDFSLPPFTQAGFNEQGAVLVAERDKVDEQKRLLNLRRAALDGAIQVYQRMAQVARAVEAGNTIDKLSDTVEIR